MFLPRNDHIDWGIRSPQAMLAHLCTWQHWDDRYKKFGHVFGESPHPKLVTWAATRLDKSGQVLCVGDGYGRNSRHLAEIGLQVVSVELCRQAYLDAILADRLPVERYHGDLLRWLDAFKGRRFDAVVSVHALLPSSDEAMVAARLSRMINPGGASYLLANSAVTDPGRIRAHWPDFVFQFHQEDHLLEAIGVCAVSA